MIEYRDEIPSVLSTSYQDNDLQKNSHLELIEHPNLINPTSDNNLMLRNVSQYNVGSFHELNKALSGTYNLTCLNLLCMHVFVCSITDKLYV